MGVPSDFAQVMFSRRDAAGQTLSPYRGSRPVLPSESHNWNMGKSPHATTVLILLSTDTWFWDHFGATAANTFGISELHYLI